MDIRIFSTVYCPDIVKTIFSPPMVILVLITRCQQPCQMIGAIWLPVRMHILSNFVVVYMTMLSWKLVHPYFEFTIISSHDSVSLGFWDTGNVIFLTSEFLDHLWLPCAYAGQWMQFARWGSYIVFCRNDSYKMHHFWTMHIHGDRQTDRRTDNSFALCHHFSDGA